MIPFASCQRGVHFASTNYRRFLDPDDVHVYICSNRECSLQLNSSKSCL